MVTDKNKGGGLKSILSLVEKKFGKGTIMTFDSEAERQPMTARASTPCDLCGERHELDEFKVNATVRTPSDVIGRVLYWSQYGGPLYYRIKIDPTGHRSTFRPCQLRAEPNR